MILLFSTRALPNAYKASESAWNRARLASELRHLCFKQNNHQASNLLGLIKKEALKLAYALNPSEIKVGMDDTYQIGMLSIRWRQERFHLPLRNSYDFNTPMQFASRIWWSKCNYLMKTNSFIKSNNLISNFLSVKLKTLLPFLKF